MVMSIITPKTAHASIFYKYIRAALIELKKGENIVYSQHPVWEYQLLIRFKRSEENFCKLILYPFFQIMSTFFVYE